MTEKANEIIDFWYSDRIKKQWFVSTPELDQEILERYGLLWERALLGEFDAWMAEPNSCLALAIVLDQFPLNMFRGEAKSFASERKSIEVAKAAVNNGFVQQLDKDKLAFLFMPLMHSENLLDQVLSVSLFKENDIKGNIRFAEHHQNIIKTYGRFPHRNSILGRPSTDAELEYLDSDGAFNG